MEGRYRGGGGGRGGERLREGAIQRGRERWRGNSDYKRERGNLGTTARNQYQGWTHL